MVQLLRLCNLLHTFCHGIMLLVAKRNPTSAFRVIQTLNILWLTTVISVRLLLYMKYVATYRYWHNRRVCMLVKTNVLVKTEVRAFIFLSAIL